MTYIAALFFLFLLSAFLIILVLAVHRVFTMELEEDQTIAGKIWTAIGSSIHSVLLVNNGWFMVFLTMTVLAFGIAFYTQFDRPSLVNQAIIAQERAADKNTSAQKFSHTILDWEKRKDTDKEKEAIKKDINEYEMQFPEAMYAWPWWSCSLLMFVVTIFSIPFVLSDEAAEVWQRVREHHAQGPQGDEASRHSTIGSFFDRIFHHHNTGRPIQTGPTALPPERPTGQQGSQTQNVPAFGQLLLMDFLAGLLSKIFEDLFSHRKTTT